MNNTEKENKRLLTRLGEKDEIINMYKENLKQAYKTIDDMQKEIKELNDIVEYWKGVANISEKMNI